MARITQYRLIAVLPACLGVAWLAWLLMNGKPHTAQAGEPYAREGVYTSTRYVTGIAVADDGTVWMSTLGGVLRYSAGEWRKFTRADGLPSHEVRGIRIEHGEAVAFCPTSSAIYREGQWTVEATPRPLPHEHLREQQTCAGEWLGKIWVATATGLQVKEGNGWRTVPLPPSRGTHISALLPCGRSLWAAMYGDGVWIYDGKSWKQHDVALPEQAREVTAMAATGNTLWVGTRRQGLWSFDGEAWRQYLQADEPYDHNCQAMAVFHGVLYISTLEDGLVLYTAEGWKRCTVPAISSDAPRQMVVFRDTLYLRHGNGKIDAFDGERWTTNLGKALPRREVAALATDGERLYAAQWGGWSEFDGTRWTSNLTLPELQGLSITAVLPDGKRVWLGTQQRGLAEIEREKKTVRWHDERHGLPDDWVKCFARVGSTIYAGTFVGGLAAWDGERWSAGTELAKDEITALVPDDAGKLWIGTRFGLRIGQPDGRIAQVNQPTYLDQEIQCLCPMRDGMWVGTRTGFYFISRMPTE